MVRVGSGYDCHQFEEGDHFFLGGVKIPYSRGVKAHSDGDVLLHALGDALLGAAALGDLGQHFPDTDPQYQSISSIELIKIILKLLVERNFSICNIDTTIILEQPKLAPYINDIRLSLAEMLELPLTQVSVKATTHEKMGAFGRGEGLAVQATVLIS